MTRTPGWEKALNSAEPTTTDTKQQHRTFVVTLNNAGFRDVTKVCNAPSSIQPATVTAAAAAAADSVSRSGCH